jgi:N-acetylglucosaminyl-diphospho-decaprenol L-rhamnosyltransferase
MADVAVVIGNYEGEALLGDCIESLQRQTHRPVEIVVADAHSKDGSVAIARAGGARVIELENRGLGSLYNAGLRATSAPYVLLSNNDVAYDSRCVAHLVAALDEEPERFAADARQLDWDSDDVIKARTTLSRGPILHEFLPGLHLEHAAHADEIVPTVAAHGAAMLVRRDMFLELGGFDETFFMDVEDLDLCWRAWLRGWPSVYVPEASLRHRVGAVTTAGILPRRLASSHHNMVRFAMKCLPGATVARVLAGELLRLPRHPRSIVPALAGIARELPEILRLRRDLRPSTELLDWMLRGQPT